MSLAELQAEVSAAMSMVFDYFKRTNPVVFYKDTKEQVVYVDPNWNADFGYGDQAQIVQTTQKQSFNCRVFFLKEPSMIKNIDGDENIGIKTQMPVGELKIQVEPDGFSWLRDSKAYYVEGERYVAVADWRGVGLLNSYDIYELTLKKDQ